jgi:cardiolipin synthase
MVSRGEAQMDSLWSLITLLFVIYIIGAAIFIILENRTPASTFAWLLLFIALPVVGVLIYIFVGRDQRIFTEENTLNRQEIDKASPELARLLFDQEDAIRQVNEMPNQSSTHRRLAELLYRTKLSVLTVHNEVEILQDASVMYPRHEEDIRQAKQSVHMQYFIWQADEYMQKFGDLLIEKAKEGVQIRILYDALGSSLLTAKHKDYLEKLRAGGVQIYPYLNYLKLFKFHTINYRNHRKITVIDGKIGYTGGLNMGEEHLKGAGPYDAWRDTHMRITGNAVSVLQGIFVKGWYNTTKEKLADPAYFVAATESAGFIPTQIVGSGPDSQWYAIQQQYFYMILAAEKSVYIQSPFFIPDPSIEEALKAAALSGVDVRLMCAPRDTENPISNWAANTYFCDMVRAGVRVFLYQPGYLHAKTMCIDGSLCSIGTANMDMRSLQVNYELNTVLYDKALSQKLEKDFMHDLGGCVEFTLEAYKKEPLHLRFRDSAARLLSPLL